MKFQSTAKLDVAGDLPAEVPLAAGPAERNADTPHPDLHTILPPSVASTTLGLIGAAGWILAFAAPVAATGATSLLPYLAAGAAALLCTALDRVQAVGDIRQRAAWFAPVIAVAVAFAVGGLLTFALTDAAPAPLAWWRGAGLSAGVAGAAQILLLVGGVLARRSGRFATRVAIIGPSCAARFRLVEAISSHATSTVIAMAEPADFRLITARAAAGELDEVVLMRDSGPSLRTALDALTLFPIDVTLVDEAPVGAGARPVSHVIQQQRQRGLPAVAKRMIDVVGAIVCLIVLSPLLLLIAAAIRLETPGPAIFKQRRFGQHGRTFMMWKFRSMRSEASDPTGSKLTSRNDDRVTRVGAVIRKTSFDELPQLINILLGDLSFVGPRPHPSGATANGVLYDVLIPNFRARYRVRPGLTGLAQCSGLRGNTDTEKKLFDRFDADMRYVETWSLGLDVLIVLRTVGHLLRGENAY